MSEIAGGEVFADGQTVNAARLNNHVNGAVIQPGLITDKSAVTPAGNDYVLLYQSSSLALKKATVTNLNQTGGNVTSVALSMPVPAFTVAGSPITGAGTITVGWAAQSGNKQLASPADGSAAVPAFRSRDPRDTRFATLGTPGAVINWNLGSNFFTNLSGDTTFTFQNSNPGGRILVGITHSGHKALFPTAVKWENNIAPIPTSNSTIFEFANISGFIFGWILAQNAS